MFQEEFNGFLDVFLCFFAKSFKEGKPVFIACIQQFTHGFNLHFFPDGIYFFRTDAFDA